ncbi:MAG TPA: DUF1573 domain-containing protein, partial [Planctomycetaceae bacterium]|nr:DUF1573 domain-containing protein [Planctomycetaceae bacterium]
MNAIVSPARGRKLAAACLAAAALAPFGASLAFHAAGPVAQAGARSVERPALVFEQYLVNLREIPPMQEASARFAFANLGDEPLTITALEPGCGCLSPRLEKRTYRAGESGEFFVRIQTASEKPGRKEYAVTVRYTDSVPRETKLIFKV